MEKSLEEPPPPSSGAGTTPASTPSKRRDSKDSTKSTSSSSNHHHHHRSHKHSNASSSEGSQSPGNQRVPTKNIGVGVNLMISKHQTHNSNLSHPVSTTTTTSLSPNPTSSSSSTSRASLSYHHHPHHSNSPPSTGGIMGLPDLQLGNRMSPNAAQQLQQRSNPLQNKGEEPGAPKLGPPRIVSQNSNGTLAVTRLPTNDSELQLYRVLQRANLVTYFDGMIELGGDDVQQLCEAGEEEFLEIMSLIGMASKPLHVRRFQKALQEWMTSGGALSNGDHPSLCTPGSNSHSPIPQIGPQPQVLPVRPLPLPLGGFPSFPGVPIPIVTSAGALSHPPSAFVNQPEAPMRSSHLKNSHSNSNSPNSVHSGISSHSGSKSDQIIPSHYLETRIRTQSEENSPASLRETSDSPQLDSRTSLSPIPFLQEQEVLKLAEVAIKIVESLPPTIYEPRITNKKKLAGDYEAVMRISETDPNRMDEIRKYAAIYGRYDCKRKLQKPLTVHELSVNEGAAQLCRHIPALLTRRDELFPLARQVVRDAGLPYMCHLNGSSVLNPGSSSPQSQFAQNVGNHLKNGFLNNNNSSLINYNNTNGQIFGNHKKIKLYDGRGMEITEYTRNVDFENHSEEFHRKFYPPNEFPIISPIDMKKEKHGGYSIITNQSSMNNVNNNREELNNPQPDDLSIHAKYMKPK